MAHSTKVIDFINKYSNVLDESVEKFLELTYEEHLANRYVQELIATLNEAGIDTIEEQWKLFSDYFEAICEDDYYADITKLSVLLPHMSNWFGLNFDDIKFSLVDHSYDWDFNDMGEVVRA